MMDGALKRLKSHKLKNSVFRKTFQNTFLDLNMLDFNIVSCNVIKNLERMLILVKVKLLFMFLSDKMASRSNYGDAK